MTGRTERFGAAPDATLTVLVDNRADLIVQSTDTVRYFTRPPLLAEHGFAVLIDLPSAKRRILWDTGLTPLALVENLKSMKIDPATIDAIAISHGHYDHTGGVTAVLNALHAGPKPSERSGDATAEETADRVKAQRTPLIVHPAAFRERWSMREDGTRHGPQPSPPRGEWEAAGAEITLSETPFELGPGCWTTGQVPRLSFERADSPPTRLYREDATFLPDLVDDDQAVVINVKEKGLVILSGCAHSGIVNTINHAHEISGVDKVWAILGGFHLARAADIEIERTIDAILRCRPALVVPSHCTGFRAMCMLTARMPEVTRIGVVGAAYHF